jgi:ABC-type transport system involved in multi-copper enzyme maturation permease subunit
MWHNLRRALIITKREVRDQFRDWRIIGPILILTLFFPGLMNFTANQVVGYVEKYDVPLIGDRLLPFLLMVVGFFPISVSLVIALESFVGEKERRSIEPLLNSPLTDLQLYLGKLLAVVVPPVTASYLGIGVYLYGVYRQVGWTPEPRLLIQIVILTTVQALLMVCGAVVISVQATSARAANLLASFIIVPVALLLVGESMVMFWANYGALWWVIFGQILIASLLIRSGIAYFNREELLGRELDTINLRWSWNVFVNAFVGKSKSIKAWYHHVFTEVLPAVLVPSLIVVVSVIVGGWIGAWQSERFVLPPDTLNWDNLDQGFIQGIDGIKGLGTFRFFSVNGVSTVWLHNLRTLLITLVSALFTFGVLGVLVLMLPFVIIGFFTATVANVGISPWIFLIAFVLPHGLIEIPAVVLAGGAALKLGATLTAPARGRTMSEALLESLADWVKIMIALVIPLLLAAAVLEIYVTPRVALKLLGN